MQGREMDTAMTWLFCGSGSETVNLKFFRGSRDMISADDFCRQIHGAIMQKKLKAARPSAEPPKSEQPTIDVREFVKAL